MKENLEQIPLNQSNKNKLWNPTLTKRYINLLKIHPILAIKDSLIGSGYKEIYKKYDALAIALKIIELIIENTHIHDGITQHELFLEIQPLFLQMDKFIPEFEVTEEDHLKIFEFILEKLVYQSRKEGIRQIYTDYSTEPPEIREIVFRLITYKNIHDVKIVLSAEPEAINFFLQMLDIPLEDRHLSEILTIRRQIDRREFSDALESANQDHHTTLLYQMKIENIITKTKRNIRLIDWKIEVPQELDKAFNHITECITKQRDIIEKLLDYMGEQEFQSIQESLIIEELVEKIKDALDSLFPLQKSVAEARSVFLEQQWIQELFSYQSNRLDLEKEVFDVIGILQYSALEEFKTSILTYFQKPTPCQLFSFSNLLSYAFQHSQIKEIPIRKKRFQYRKEIDSFNVHLNYPKSLKMEVLDFFRQKLTNRESEWKLSELLQIYKAMEKNFEYYNYLRLFIQFRSLNEKYDYRLFPEKLKISPQKDRFECKINDKIYFEGNDYLVSYIKSK